jgi:predicted house-cleaning noncanonical NTP pyrophosphatase (MazG superfamily)
METENDGIQQVSGVGATPDPVRTVPTNIIDTLREDIAEAGGEMELPTEYDGSIGRTMFDSPSSEDGTLTVLMPRENLETLPMQTMVRIKSVADGRSYLGVTVKGPFAEPDGLRADATPLVAITIKGGILMPKYHGRAQVELLGEELPDGAVVPPRRRPLPNSPVFVLSSTETAEVLRTGGDICLGLVEGKEEIEVRFPSGLKSVLPRHLGILGTTGGGKSTTVSGLIAQFQAAGLATVLFDTEGEYTAIYEPTSDPRMLQALARRQRRPGGVDNTHVYHLVGRETRNPAHPSLTEFRLDFSEISPNAFKEILGLSDAQEHRFFQAYDVCKLLLRDLGVFPRPGHQGDERIALELDEQETGYPYMTLSHLIDIASVFQHVVAKSDGDPAPFNPVFKNDLQKVLQRVKAVKSDHEVSWRALLARLWRIHRLKIFDNPKAKSIDYSEILQPGRVSIIDLSDTDSPDVNNLVIAQILRGLQSQQDQNYQEAAKQNASPVPAMVLIEEAHEFLSSQRIKEMPILFQQVARIARRGRKRWLGLGFITQLPQHLPDEVLGLINNWVLHKISDSGVVNRLQRSIGGVDDSLWHRLPGLAPGQAIVVMASLARPIQTTIDPTPCRLLMVD